MPHNQIGHQTQPTRGSVGKRRTKLGVPSGAATAGRVASLDDSETWIGTARRLVASNSSPGERACTTTHSALRVGARCCAIAQVPVTTAAVSATLNTVNNHQVRTEVRLGGRPTPGTSG